MNKFIEEYIKMKVVLDEIGITQDTINCLINGEIEIKTLYEIDEHHVDIRIRLKE